jgi:hypothetical protein
MQITLKEKGEVLAAIRGKEVTSEDKKVRECLEALIANHELNQFPPHIDKDQMLEDVIKAFAFVNNYEVEE